ncbi:MAG: hypothetical protein ACR2NP_11335 [Pirellulaceae bacterium]
MHASDSSPSATPETGDRLPLWWWIVVGISFLARMYVVADDEIVPRVYDSVSYAQIAAHYFSPNDPYAFLPLHRPGLGILAWSVAELGIPYKLFLDGLLGLASLMAAIVFFRMTGARLASLFVMLAISWHPWFIIQSWMFMTESVVSILLLLLLICAVNLICRPISEWSLPMALLAGVTASVFVLMRNELPVLAGFYGVILVIAILRRRSELGRKMFTRKGSWRVVLVFVPLLMAWSSTQILKAYHQSRFGVRAMCATEADGIVDLINALYSIDPEKKARYVPVPYESLKLACEHSPVMARHEFLLLHQQRGCYLTAKRILNLDEEVGTWINWHLVDCFYGVDRRSNRQMRIAAREIRQAVARGDLPGRRARFPIDPLWREWLPELPGKFWTAVYASTRNFDQALESDLELFFVDSSIERSFFDKGLLRRGGTGLNHTLYLNARCHGKETQITSAQVFTQDNELIAEVPVRTSFEGFPAINLKLGDSDNFDTRKPLALRMVREGHPVSLSTIIPLGENSWDSVKTCYFNFESEDQPFHQESWRVSYDRYLPENKVRQNVRNKLNSRPWLGLLLAVIAAFGTALFVKTDHSVIRNVVWVAVAGLCFLAGRSMFYTLVDVWLSWGLNRYVHPNAFIAIFSLACLSFVGGALIRALVVRLSAKSKRSESETLA